MKRIKKSKLSLSAESVRELTSRQLEGVAGGATTFCPGSGLTCVLSACATVTCSGSPTCSIYPTCGCGNG